MLADRSYLEPGDNTRIQVLQPAIFAYRIINVDSMKAAKYLIPGRTLNRQGTGTSQLSFSHSELRGVRSAINTSDIPTLNQAFSSLGRGG
jgi:hypothetical protein